MEWTPDAQLWQAMSDDSLYETCLKAVEVYRMIKYLWSASKIERSTLVRKMKNARSSAEAPFPNVHDLQLLASESYPTHHLTMSQILLHSQTRNADDKILALLVLTQIEKAANVLRVKVKVEVRRCRIRIPRTLSPRNRPVA